MSEQNHTDLYIHTSESAMNVRAYSVSLEDRDLKQAIIAGPDIMTVGVFANLVTGGCSVKACGYYLKLDEFHYRRQMYPIGSRWSAMLILSKDPRCLWQDDDSGLTDGIRRLTETPFLPEWVPYIRMRLEEEGLLTKLTGHEPMGSFFNATSEQLDKIVSEGVKRKRLKLKGAA